MLKATSQVTSSITTIENSSAAKIMDIQKPKMERCISTSSESSLEQLDIGRTPKKTITSTTSTPNAKSTNSDAIKNNPNSITCKYTKITKNHHHFSPHHLCKHTDSDAGDYEDEESGEDSASHKSSQTQLVVRPQRHHHHHHHHHHKWRSSGRDKRNVQLEFNAENPHSLRKKFRFSSISNSGSIQHQTNGSDIGITATTKPTKTTADLPLIPLAANRALSMNNNESGFVDASSTGTNSHILNASAVSSSRHSPSAASQSPPSSSLSASPSHVSSPAQLSSAISAASVSSPESGIGERDDMKYLCPICEVVSATPHEFTNHIRCHNYSSGDTENFTCRICSKVLSSASSLDRHVLVHTGERPFNCKYCHLTFTTNGNMHRHMRTHKQHQHNHRRNSNGTTKNGVLSAASTMITTPAVASNATLTNGEYTAKSLTPVVTSTTVTASTTLFASADNQHSESVINNTQNSNIINKRIYTNGVNVQNYESDGGCSSDSSSAISQSSNNNNNNDSTNHNNNNISNFKRKSVDNLDDVGLLKRRVKTTINNNIIDEHDDVDRSSAVEIRRLLNVEHQQHQQHQQHYHQYHPQQQPLLNKLSCPVCNRCDFEDMLTLSIHMDGQHSDIPAKCRHCDVVFRTHRQLNVHPCTGKFKITHGFKDLTFVDFSSEKFPLIAKSLCEKTLRTAVSNQKFVCHKCYRAFPCATAVEIHEKDCGDDETTKHFNTAQDLSSSIQRKQRSFSESSLADAEHGVSYAEGGDEADGEDNRRDEFFARLYLKNKSQAQSMTSLSDRSDVKFEDIEMTPKNHTQSCSNISEHIATHQHHDSRDLADIQSILNMTSSSTSNFLKNFENSVNTPSSNYGTEKDEEEAQDAFTSEFRKMKLRGEFPCKLCTAVFPNLRALKGHNRIHLSAAGAGPYRCNMCPHTIHDKAALVRHMRTHNGDRPYECAVCNYAFTTKANCERHLRNRHAKTTRDDVKRAIIYHPSEDSSCDDPVKKLHMFSSPEFDQDDVEQNYPPKDRSTPVSHLKEMLTSNDTSQPIKIQVKSLEKLLDKSTASTTYRGEENYDDGGEELDSLNDTACPIDLSMDVLDLSKKSKVQKSDNSVDCSQVLQVSSAVADRPQTPSISAVTTNIPEISSRPTPEEPKVDLAVLEKNQQFLLAQQQMINDAMPKMDPTQYFQQLYRNFVFPPLHPFLFQNSFLPNNLNDLNKFGPLMNRMFSGNANESKSSTASDHIHISQLSNSLADNCKPLITAPASPSPAPTVPITVASTPPAQLLPKSHAPSPTSPHINIPRHTQMIPTTHQHQNQHQQQHTAAILASHASAQHGGPVKMVIKNGVLMPKQKQRRYRTERPFACEHCSARFTLRSNMERHIKQQHPQYWAQRQRSGHHIMRGRGASNSSILSHIHSTTQQQLVGGSPLRNSLSPNPLSAISEHVKYAILAQQLKARKDTDLLQQALSHGSSSVAPRHLALGAATIHNPKNHVSQTINGSVLDDDEPKLIIDEDDDEQHIEEAEDNEMKVNEDVKPENLSKYDSNSTNNVVAKKVAETILEQAIKAGSSSVIKANSQRLSVSVTSSKDIVPPPSENKDFSLKISNKMIAQAESVGKFLKEVASSPFKDESNDLASVSKLVDNATNPVSFNNYFRPSDVANHMEQSDEEGLVASGSASESNNSGPEDMSSSMEPKKKSAYSLAPNRVSCPYCQRMFPWSSSLRRHILTHTGQKPFKCSHCPLLFTTKSNCDRHLLRKHGNVESAVSLYVPIEDVSEPLPVPKSVEEIEQQQLALQRLQEEEELKEQKFNLEQQKILQQQEKEQERHQQHQQILLKQLSQSPLNLIQPTPGSSPKISSEINQSISSSELPYKCHLCDSSFSERFQCLDHIKIHHAQDFALLLAKGAIDTEAEPGQVQSTEDDERRDDSRGKYPDYSNRKVICAFCVRRFWSTEDLRRHMRTHSGERPFQCDICFRKFTLKHSMLRHMKKHNGEHTSSQPNTANSGSDMSDDEQQPVNTTLRSYRIQELLSKAASEWRNNRLSGEHKENIEEHNNSDLIGNLLGISDQGILNKLLSSADEAAKFLGVDNK